MHSIRYFLLVLGFILAVTLFRKVTCLPVAPLDIFFFPFSLYVLFFGIKSLLKTEKNKNKHPSVNRPRSLLSCIWQIGFLLLLAAMGGGMFWIGVQAPLTLFEGVRGGLYGYTLVPLGLCFLGFSLFGVFETVRLFAQRRDAESSSRRL